MVESNATLEGIIHAPRNWAAVGSSTTRPSNNSLYRCCFSWILTSIADDWWEHKNLCAFRGDVTWIMSTRSTHKFIFRHISLFDSVRVYVCSALNFIVAHSHYRRIGQSTQDIIRIAINSRCEMRVDFCIQTRDVRIKWCTTRANRECATDNRSEKEIPLEFLAWVEEICYSEHPLMTARYSRSAFRRSLLLMWCCLYRNPPTMAWAKSENMTALLSFIDVETLPLIAWKPCLAFVKKSPNLIRKIHLPSFCPSVARPSDALCHSTTMIATVHISSPYNRILCRRFSLHKYNCNRIYIVIVIEWMGTQVRMRHNSSVDFNFNPTL